MRYLLDTDIVSDQIRNPQGPVTRRIREVGEAQVCTSMIVAAELRCGATKKASPRRTARNGAGRVGSPAHQGTRRCVYGQLRTRLEQSGRLIGNNELLIAAQAVALGHAIVTDNHGGFARIDGLRCGNWRRQA